MGTDGYIPNGGGTCWREPKQVISGKRRKRRKPLPAMYGWHLVFKHCKDVTDSTTILPGCDTPDIRMHCRYEKDSL